MEIYSPTLFIEINKSDYIFLVGDENEQGNFILIYKCIVPIQGIENYRIINFNQVLSDIKKNIYLIESKFNFTFKDTVLIINNFNLSFINLTGFKKLNGSQILKENITYILNSLKSHVNETENKKTIIHIFNSKFNLDKKKIENLPIGLFGDFYSHELSFCLINSNDYNNLNNIFNKCNLKLKKILLKSFAEGSYISNRNKSLGTFFQIQIDTNNSKIFYFENHSLKFEQNFNFGTNLIIGDISKVTSLKKDTVEKIIKNTILTNNILKDELISKNFFENSNYIKIKTKLLSDIAEARIEEILYKLLIKNINLFSLNKKNKEIFLKISDKSHLNCFKNIYSSFFSKQALLKADFAENISSEDLIKSVNQIVHFGWKKEAVPIIQPQKSLIARLFDTFFN